MIGYLYRYSHPFDTSRFIYVGQETNLKKSRDRKHREGVSSFGRRFKKLFPGVELPKPIRRKFEVNNHIELNELETIWMFRFHTWRGYEGGMNLTLPGSKNYKELAKLGGLLGGRERIRLHGNPATPVSSSKGGRKQGPIQGARNILSGHIQELGRTNAKKNNSIVEHQRNAARSSQHVRFHTKRNQPNSRCALCNSAVTYA